MSTDRPHPQIFRIHDSIGVLVVSGAGRPFCAGGELEALQGGSEPGAWVPVNVDDIRRNFPRVQPFMLALQRVEQPVTATVNWAAVQIWRRMKPTG